MSGTSRLVALALVAALAACGKDASVPQGLLLAEPSAVAVFRGFSPGRPPAAGVTAYPFMAIANAASNDLTIVDGISDLAVPAPVSLRTLVVPVPDRPVLLASASLGDGDTLADLLVAVSAGGSSLQVIRTWAADLGIEGEVELPGDVLALAALRAPSSGQVRIVAALSGRQVAVVTFARAGAGIAPAGTGVATLSFQAVALAALPDETGRVWAATPELDGVVEIGVDLSGAPSEGPLLPAGGPTRLVAAARLAAERGAGAAGLDPLGWATTAPVNRVYAVLDEPGCGLGASVGCGLVALDADGAVLADFADPLLPRAPVVVPGRPLALAASGPPAQGPPGEAFQPPYMRMFTAQGKRATTGVAAVPSTDGAVYLVDLGRWELPSDQLVHRGVGATVTPVRPAAAAAIDQWLVLEPQVGGTALSHLDAAALSTAAVTTPGFTSTARWTVTHEGALPGLGGRRAESGDDGGVPWLALQVGVPAASEVVRLYDPTLGVRGGDTVIVDATGLGTCARFEATVDPVVPFLDPDATRPGGAVRLVAKGDPLHPEWDACTGALRAPGPDARLRATIRGGGASPFVLVREGPGAPIHAGRPALGALFAIEAADEGAFSNCLLPPRVAWPASPALPPACDAGCRTACEALLQARLGRRVAYVPERCADVVDPVQRAACVARFGEVTDVEGPALAFVLALETGAAPPRDLQLVLETREGRTPLRVADPLGGGVEPRSAVAFDRSPYSAPGGIRFLVPYASGVLLDVAAQGGGGALR